MTRLMTITVEAFLHEVLCRRRGLKVKVRTDPPFGLRVRIYDKSYNGPILDYFIGTKDIQLGPEGCLEALQRAVRQALTPSPKRLPPKASERSRRNLAERAREQRRTCL